MDWGWVPLASILAFLIAALFSRPGTEAEPFRLGPLDPRVAIPVLCYHGVVDEVEFEYEVSVGSFREQLEELRRLGRNPVTASQLVAGLAGQERLPSLPVVLTFDDGLRSLLTRVAPILKEFGWKATAFMNPSYVGKKRLTWDEWRELSADGWDVQSHGFSHRRLTREPGEDQDSYLAAVKEEISSSKRAIEEALGKPVDLIAYPYGLYDRQSAELAREAGYRAAFGLNGGPSNAEKSPFMLDRILVVPGTTIESFRSSVKAKPLRVDLGPEATDGGIRFVDAGADMEFWEFSIEESQVACAAEGELPEFSVQGRDWSVELIAGGNPRRYRAKAPEPPGRGAKMGRVSVSCADGERKYCWLFHLRTHGR